jgi:hypothetical protein
MTVTPSEISLIMSAGALLISISSFIFAIKAWRETHRPIVTAFVRCPHSGNTGTGLEIVVSNSGNRPAIDVQLHVPQKTLEKALEAPKEDVLRKAVERCFANETFIPVLEGGKEVTNSYGIFTLGDKPDTWNYKSIFDVVITYKNLSGRKFKNANKLYIICNKGFALSYYED